MGASQKLFFPETGRKKNTLFQVNRVKAIKKEKEVWYDVVASLFDAFPLVVVGAREDEGMEQEDIFVHWCATDV